MDKVRFADHATAHGLPVPARRCSAHRADAERAAAVLVYPCV